MEVLEFEGESLKCQYSMSNIESLQLIVTAFSFEEFLAAMS